ncbi:MAG: DsbA family protein [Alphaproteobacteria bacterium]|nr:DsbA family protein [Alphaproteobacteria bacterium]
MRIRSTLAALALSTTLVMPAVAADTAKTYTRAELEQIIVETILKHPEALIQSVDNMQKSQASKQAETAKQNIEAYKTSLFNDPESPVAGNKKGDVTVVEFFDYNCGYCKRSFDEILKLSQTDKNVRFVFKEYPVLAPSSETAARASLAFHALNPDRYLDYHASLFRLGGRFDEETLANTAENFGVKADKLKEKMKDPKITKHLQDNAELASKLGARGVPLFVIGSDIAPGALSYEDLQSRVGAAREELKKKK